MLNLGAEDIEGILHLLVVIAAKSARCVSTHPVNDLVRNDVDQVEAAVHQVQAHGAVDREIENDTDHPRDRVKLSVGQCDAEHLIEQCPPSNHSSTAQEEADYHENWPDHNVQQKDVAMARLVPHAVPFPAEMGNCPKRRADDGFAYDHQPVDTCPEPNHERHHGKVGRQCPAQNEQGDNRHNQEGRNGFQHPAEHISH
ncbi:hypothetical protein D3C77_340140 [compost metagenome]